MTTRGRHRCACRRVLLAAGDVPELEQVGVDLMGPRLVEHARERCGPRRGPPVAVGPLRGPAPEGGPAELADERLRARVEALRVPGVLPAPPADAPPPPSHWAEGRDE